MANITWYVLRLLPAVTFFCPPQSMDYAVKRQQLHPNRTIPLSYGTTTEGIRQKSVPNRTDPRCTAL